MRYRVYLEAVASTSVEVEADDKEDAYQKALQEALPRICAKCAGWGQEVGMDLGEWEIRDEEDDIEEIAGGDR